jgi:hypothetical protein
MLAYCIKPYYFVPIKSYIAKNSVVLTCNTWYHHGHPTRGLQTSRVVQLDNEQAVKDYNMASIMFISSYW